MTVYSAKRCEDFFPRCCEGTLIPVLPPPPVAPPGVFADYYALAPTDNAQPIAAGSAVAFPRGESSSISAISRINDGSFNLAKEGAYLVLFNVGSDNPAQLELTLNSTPLAYTVTGGDVAGAEINGMAIVKTTQPNSVLSLINPAGSAESITVTQNSGGTNPSSSHLIIVKL